MTYRNENRKYGIVKMMRRNVDDDDEAKNIREMNRRRGNKRWKDRRRNMRYKKKGRRWQGIKKKWK